MLLLFSNQNSVDHPEQDLMVNDLERWRSLSGLSKWNDLLRVVWARSAP
jgi:hypothetical protein